MPEIPHWTRSGTRERVMRSLTATEAAEAAAWYAGQGAYRIGAVLLQLAAAVEASEPSPAPDNHTEALTEDTRALVALATVDAPTEVLERGSHAPTTCAYPMQAHLCGEVIRWSHDIGWFHVNDRHLGESDHPATPGQ